MPRLALLAVALAIACAPRTLRGEDAAPLAVPLVSGLTLDGVLDEPAWEQALLVSCDRLEVPAPPPGARRVPLQPQVRLAQQSDGRLWIGVRADEDPGMSVGLRAFVGADGLANAADALAIAFAPQDLRVARWSVRTPKGVSRRHCRVEGAAGVGARGRWSLEVALPLADLGLAGPGAPLRLVLAVATRTPNLLAAAPAGALWQPPSAWLRIAPAGGAWAVADVPESLALEQAKQDAVDEERLAAWREFQVNSLEALPAGPPEALRKAVEGRLLEPLAHVARLRPDLAPWVAWVRGDLLQRVGEPALAEAAYREALAAMPGLREASFQLHVKLLGSALAEGLPQQPTEFAAALARVERETAGTSDPYALEGLRLARGLLEYKRGEFARAVEALEPLAARYAAEPLVVRHLELARECLETWGDEQQRRQQDERLGTLPRVALRTARGQVTLELFEDDVPNTVRNFVWLVDHGFYDGLAFHRNVPFFALQSGDPFSREGAEARWLGGGGPGYALPGEPSARRPTRGAVAMATLGPDTAGSQFVLLLGTAAHLDASSVVFGRIVEGQDVADALREGERIERAEVLRRRPGVDYRPTTVGRTPAPEPRATPPVPDGR